MPLSSERKLENIEEYRSHDKDTGSASSLIQSSFLLTGSIGMMFISLDWSDRILVLGMMSFLLNLGGLLLWFYTKKRCRVPKHFV